MSPIDWQPLPRRRRTARGYCLAIAGAAWCAGVFASVTDRAWNIAVDLAIIGVCAAALVGFFRALGPWRA